MEREVNVRSDDELDAVVGGMKNNETAAYTAFMDGFYLTAGRAAIIMFQGSASAAQAAAGE